MILIKDGRVIDPKTRKDEILDVILHDGKIHRLGKYQATDDYERIINAKGCIVAPGLIDVHVHFRDPGLTHKEDLETGARAAARGGFTTVICMANTKPPVDSEAALSDILSRAEKLPIRILQASALTQGMKGEELVDFEALLSAGAAGFSDDGLPITDTALALLAMQRAKQVGAVLSFHEEDPSILGSPGVNRGPASEALSLPGALGASETVLVARDCALALETGARINIQHVSHGASVEAIRLFKSLGADIWAEVTPHHFSLTEEDVAAFGTNAKMNPPLRTEDDRYKIIEGLKDGTIAIIATDHAPHTEEEKSAEFKSAPSGIIGLETALSLGITKLVRKGHLTMERLIEKMTQRPAELYGLDTACIERDAPADLVIFDPGEKWTVDSFASKSKNSPFIGETLHGRVKYTICRGEVVYDTEARA